MKMSSLLVRRYLRMRRILVSRGIGIAAPSFQSGLSPISHQRKKGSSKIRALYLRGIARLRGIRYNTAQVTRRMHGHQVVLRS